MSNPFQMVGHVIGAVGSLAVVKGLGSWIAGEGVSQGADFVKKQLVKRFEERRDEFWSWLTLDEFRRRYPSAAQTFVRRQRERTLWRENNFPPNAEDYMVNTLVDLWSHMNEAGELEWRFVIFKELAELKDDEFAAMLDAYNNDGIKQYVLMVVYGFGQAAKWLGGLANELNTQLEDSQVIQKLGELAGIESPEEMSRPQLVIALLVSGKNEFAERDRRTAERIRDWRNGQWWLRGA